MGNFQLLLRTTWTLQFPAPPRSFTNKLLVFALIPQDLYPTSSCLLGLASFQNKQDSFLFWELSPVKPLSNTGRAEILSSQCCITQESNGGGGEVKEGRVHLCAETQHAWGSVRGFLMISSVTSGQTPSRPPDLSLCTCKMKRLWRSEPLQACKLKTSQQQFHFVHT